MYTVQKNENLKCTVTKFEYKVLDFQGGRYVKLINLDLTQKFRIYAKDVINIEDLTPMYLEDLVGDAFKPVCKLV